MRAWGIAFCITAAGCVILGQIDVHLALMLIAVVSITAAFAVAREYTDRREQLEIVRRADLTETLGWFGELRQTNVDAEWESLVEATTPRVPAPREPGAAS